MKLPLRNKNLIRFTAILSLAVILSVLILSTVNSQGSTPPKSWGMRILEDIISSLADMVVSSMNVFSGQVFMRLLLGGINLSSGASLWESCIINPHFTTNNPNDVGVSLNTDSRVIQRLGGIILQILIMPYALLIVLTAIQMIYASNSPNIRAQVKSQLQKLIMGLVFCGLAFPIYDLLLKLNNSLVLMILNTDYSSISGAPKVVGVCWDPITNFIVSSGGVGTMVVIGAVTTLVIATGGTGTGLLITLVLGMICGMVMPYMVLALRWNAVLAFGTIFPFTIFCQSFNFTTGLGTKLMKQTLTWIFLPVPMAVLVVVTAQLGTSIEPMNVIAELITFMMIGLSPMMISGMLSILGSASVAAGNTLQNSRLVFMGHMMSGSGASALTQTASQSFYYHNRGQTAADTPPVFNQALAVDGPQNKDAPILPGFNSQTFLDHGGYGGPGGTKSTTDGKATGKRPGEGEIASPPIILGQKAFERELAPEGAKLYGKSGMGDKGISAYERLARMFFDRPVQDGTPLSAMTSKQRAGLNFANALADGNKLAAAGWALRGLVSNVSPKRLMPVGGYLLKGALRGMMSPGGQVGETLNSIANKMTGYWYRDGATGEVLWSGGWNTTRGIRDDLKKTIGQMYKSDSQTPPTIRAAMTVAGLALPLALLAAAPTGGMSLIAVGVMAAGAAGYTKINQPVGAAMVDDKGLDTKLRKKDGEDPSFGEQFAKIRNKKDKLQEEKKSVDSQPESPEKAGKLGKINTELGKLDEQERGMGDKNWGLMNDDQKRRFLAIGKGNVDDAKSKALGFYGGKAASGWVVQTAEAGLRSETRDLLNSNEHANQEAVAKAQDEFDKMGTSDNKAKLDAAKRHQELDTEAGERRWAEAQRVWGGVPKEDQEDYMTIARSKFDGKGLSPVQQEEHARRHAMVLAYMSYDEKLNPGGKPEDTFLHDAAWKSKEQGWDQMNAREPGSGDRQIERAIGQAAVELGATLALGLNPHQQSLVRTIRDQTAEYDTAERELADANRRGDQVGVSDATKRRGNADHMRKGAFDNLTNGLTDKQREAVWNQAKKNAYTDVASNPTELATVQNVARADAVSAHIDSLKPETKEREKEKAEADAERGRRTEANWRSLGGGRMGRLQKKQAKLGQKIQKRLDKGKGATWLQKRKDSKLGAKIGKTQEKLDLIAYKVSRGRVKSFGDLTDKEKEDARNWTPSPAGGKIDEKYLRSYHGMRETISPDSMVEMQGSSTRIIQKDGTTYTKEKDGSVYRSATPYGRKERIVPPDMGHQLYDAQRGRRDAIDNWFLDNQASHSLDAEKINDGEYTLRNPGISLETERGVLDRMGSGDLQAMSNNVAFMESRRSYSQDDIGKEQAKLGKAIRDSYPDERKEFSSAFRDDQSIGDYFTRKMRAKNP